MDSPEELATEGLTDPLDRILPKRMLPGLDRLGIRRVEASSGAANAKASWIHRGYASDSYHQRFTVGVPQAANRAFDTPPGTDGPPIVNNTLFVEFDELDTAAQDWELYAFAYSCSSEIVSVHARGANDFILLLRDRNQVLSIERWQITVAKGGWAAERAEAAGSGVPLPPVAPATAQIVGGGSYVRVRERSHFPFVKRAILLPNLAIPGDCFSVIPDPDARFLVLVSPQSVLSADLQSGVALTVFDSSDLLAGWQGFRSCYLSGKDGAGRILEAYTDDRYYGPVAFDADNDGVFEAKVTPADREEYTALMPQDLRTSTNL